MNPQSLAEAKQLFNSVKRGIKSIENTEVVICPPFVYLPILRASAFAKSYGGLAFGSQNCFWEKRGPFTGEISPLMLKNLGCQYVILGHSEREKYLREIDEMTNKKIKAALSAKLKPILCIGETENERKTGKIPEVLKNQIQKAFLGISSFIVHRSKFIIAYEPVWAVGTGKPCQPKEAKISLFMIRKIISQLFNHPGLSKKIKIIYGGSINSKIAKDYIKEAKFQGLLIGGASLDAKEFIKIVKEVAQA